MDRLRVYESGRSDPFFTPGPRVRGGPIGARRTGPAALLPRRRFFLHTQSFLVHSDLQRLSEILGDRHWEIRGGSGGLGAAGAGGADCSPRISCLIRSISSRETGRAGTPPHVSPAPTRLPGRRTEWGRIVAPGPISTSPMTVALRPTVTPAPTTTGAITRFPAPP